MDNELFEYDDGDEGFVLNAQSRPDAPKGRKKLLIIALASCAAAVALAGILMGIFRLKADLQTTLDRGIEQGVGAVTQMLLQKLSEYEQVTEVTDGAYAGTAELSVSQMVVELLGASGGTDMRWLSSIRLGYLTAVQGERVQADLSLYLDDCYILGAEYAMDMAEGKAYFGLPDLHEMPLISQVDTQTPFQPNGASGNSRVIDILAQEKQTVGQITGKLLRMYLSPLKAQRVEDTTVSLPDKSYPVKAICCYLDPQKAYEEKIDFLHWLSNNEDFYRLTERLYGITREQTRDLLDEYVQQLQIEPATEYILYLDGAGNPVGITVATEGKDFFELLLIREHGNTTGRLVLPSGDGALLDITEENGAVSGYVKLLSAEGDKTDIRLKELRLDAGGCSGQIGVRAPLELADNSFGALTLRPELMLDITMKNDQHRSETVLELGISEVELLQLRATGRRLENGIVQLPEDGISAEDPEALSGWLDALDYGQLLANLLEAGIPEYVVLGMLFGTTAQ